MARIRTVKPEFWIDERVGECSPTARLLFIATWNFADDNGNLERSAKQLKAQALPYDNLDCEPLLQELLEHGLLSEYAVNSHKYLHVNGFEKHQKIEKKSAPRCPLPDSSPTTTQLLPVVREWKVMDEEGNGKADQIAIVQPKQISNRPDTAADVVAFVRENLGLSGRENFWTIQDAINLSMKSFDLPAMGAASQIVNMWNDYEKADVEFRSGAAGFLKNGLFLGVNRWRLKSAEPTGKIGQLLSTVSEISGEPR